MKIWTLLCFIGLLGYSRAGEGAPNILFILTDDQGPWTTGYSGNGQTHTPNMDRLAKEGARFENAFVTTPVCSPSRVTLMTGRYASEFGVLDWIPPKSKNGLDPKTAVWPRALKEAGYETGLIGKWHIGHEDGMHPTKFGYDSFMGFLTGGTRTKNPTLEKGGKDMAFEGLTVDILTDHALEFISKKREAPFALSLHYRAPHAAFLPVSEEDWSHFAEKEIEVPSYPGLNVEVVRKMMREYLASVAGIDRNLGRLLERLDELGIAENTVVIFTSDHGYNVGHHGVWSKGNAVWKLKETPKKRWENIAANRRPNLWDTSAKVPLVVRWPGVVRPGKAITPTVSNLDWFPTLCEMGGAEVPDGIKLRGRSMAPLLRGEALADWDEDLYLEYSMREGGTQTDMRGFRTPKWKFMKDFMHPGRAELFDLVHDPGEMRNLLEAKDSRVEAVAKEMEGKVLRKMKEIEDPLLGKVETREEAKAIE